jgi:hypothetical protein
MPSFLGPSGKSFYPVAGSHSFLGKRGTFYPRAAASPNARTFQSVNRSFFTAGAGTTPRVAVAVVEDEGEDGPISG